MRFIIFFLCLALKLAASGWTPPIQLPGSGPSSGTAAVAINSSGQAVAVWSDGVSIGIHAAIFDGTTWTATNQPFTGLTNAIVPVIDEAGNATVVWTTSLFPNNHVEAARLSPFGNLTWSAPTIIDTTFVAGPSIGVDGSGNVLLVYLQSTSPRLIKSSIFSSSSLTWSAPITLDSTPGPGQAFNAPSIAVNSAGNAIAVWPHSFTMIGGNSNIRASSYSPLSMTWNAAQDVNVPSTTSSSSPLVGIDSFGNGTAAWDFGTGIVSSNYTVGTNSWSSTLTIPTIPGSGPSLGGLSTAPTGNTWVIYEQTPNINTNIYVSNLAPGSGAWTASQQLNTSGQNSFSEAIALNANGAGLAVWNETDNTTMNTIIASAFLFAGSSTWMTLSPNVTTNTSNSNLTVADVLAFSNNGTGWVVFQNDLNGSGMTLIIEASEFIAPSPSGPGTGEQIANRFLTQTDYVNVITWSVPSGISAVKFNIFRDAALTQLAGTVIAPALEFEDHNRKKKTTYTYYVVAVDGSGNSTLIATITVNPNS